MLKLQASHRSEHIRNHSLENELLSCKRSGSNFEKVPDEVEKQIDRLGFGHIYRLGNIRLDHALITALVERWRQETHTFHLPIGEVTVTLQDVESLWGLQVDGLPVIGKEEEHTGEEWQNICEDLMGFKPELSDIRGGRLRPRSFPTPFSTCLSKDATDVEVAHHTRMFLMQLFGGVLFATTDKMVPLKLLPLLHNLDTVDNYSWGSAVLACLYRSLCHGSLYTTREIAGPLALLQLWALKRFPIFNSMRATCRDKRSMLQRYRELLDGLQETQFIWQPYTETENPIWRSVTSLIFWDIIELHQPDRVMRQFGLEQAIPEIIDTDEILHRLDTRGRPGHDWESHHQSHVESWRNRYQNIADSQPIDDVMKPSDAYMTWYKENTILTISNLVPHEPVETELLCPMSLASLSLVDTDPPKPLQQLELPISWPTNGGLTLAWVIELMQAFDRGSRDLLPSEFPCILPVETFEQLLSTATEILLTEPNCVRIEDGLGSMSRVVVVGDVHGQLHDMLFLLREAGYPGDDHFFVFNGDYVDRGAWGLETLLILLAWKVLLPRRVFLLRGNHESESCSSRYGFKEEVSVKYGERGTQAYEKCLRCFEALPLASIIAGRVYTTHGGLFRSILRKNKGKSKKAKNPLRLGSLEELDNANRFISDPDLEGHRNLIPSDVLWSDPSMEPGLSLNEERGVGLLWGPDCTEEFLAKSGLKLIIRSHEGPDARVDRPGLKGMDEGYTEDHKGRSGSLITVFSAPDYPQSQVTEDRYRNKGAYIVLEPPDFDTPVFHSFEAVLPRPQVKPYYIDSDEELGT